MSSFYGSELLFDGVSSLEFDLRISNFESGGTSEGSAGSESDLVQKYIYRRTSPYYYGRLLHKPLEFNITMSNFDSKFNAIDRDLVERWLLGRSGYKKLMIVQEDMTSISFNAFVDKASIKYVGNIAVGITANIKCKEPWGFSPQQTLTKSYGGSANETISFYNDSSNDDYLYPYITFTTAGAITGNVSIKNISENNRAMIFSSLLSPNIIYTVDCDKQIVTSQDGSLILGGFNKTFFRLIPKMNNINISGPITLFNMTYQFARKIGG